jgi:cytochrome c553
MNKTITAFFAASLIGIAGPAFAVEQTVEQVCAACHGKSGNESVTPDTPKLGGQPADYLEKALRDYQSGDRVNPIMNAMAAGLSRQDIRALARYFSRQPSELGYRY